MLEDVEARAKRYIETVEKAMGELEEKSSPITVTRSAVAEVIALARQYLHDAKFFLESGKAVSSLASVAYVEGLLDGLRRIGLVRLDSWEAPAAEG